MLLGSFIYTMRNFENKMCNLDDFSSLKKKAKKIMQGVYNSWNSWKSWKSTGILKSPGNPGNWLEFCEAPGKMNKLTENEWVADPIDDAWRRETGSLFHSDGPATANAHRPYELDILASRWVQSQPLCNTVPTRPSSKHLLQWRSTLVFKLPLDATTSFMNPS